MNFYNPTRPQRSRKQLLLKIPGLEDTGFYLLYLFDDAAQWHTVALEEEGPGFHFTFSFTSPTNQSKR